MPTVRWSRLLADGVLAGPKVRLSRLVADAAGPLNPSVLWSRLEATATIPAGPKVRWSRLEATSDVAPSLAAIPAQTVEPLTTVTLTATTAPGSSTPDAYVWSVISGGPVTILGTGATVTFTAPAPLPPTNGTVVIGCTASVGGGAQSTQVTATITVLPCLQWHWTGSAWAGSRLVAV